MIARTDSRDSDGFDPIKPYNGRWPLPPAEHGFAFFDEGGDAFEVIFGGDGGGETFGFAV